MAFIPHINPDFHLQLCSVTRLSYWVRVCPFWVLLLRMLRWNLNSAHSGANYFPVPRQDSCAYPTPCESGGFSAWPMRAGTIPGPVWAPGTITYTSGCFFLWSQIVSSHTYWLVLNWILEDSPLQTSRFLPGRSPLTGSLPCELQLLCSLPDSPNSLTSTNQLGSAEFLSCSKACKLCGQAASVSS